MKKGTTVATGNAMKAASQKVHSGPGVKNLATKGSPAPMKGKGAGADICAPIKGSNCGGMK